MANVREFILTKHAIDRLRERCPEFPKSVDMIHSAALKLKATYDFMADAKEEKSFLNNSIFMTRLGEKYGFENCYTLFVRDNNVFVGVSNPRGRFIVTVLKRDDHYLQHIKNKVKKFAKKVEDKLAPYFPAGSRK